MPTSTFEIKIECQVTHTSPQLHEHTTYNFYVEIPFKRGHIEGSYNFLVYTTKNNFEQAILNFIGEKLFLAEAYEALQPKFCCNAE